MTWDLREAAFMDIAGLHLLNDQRSACSAMHRTLTVTGWNDQPLELLRLAQQVRPDCHWADFLSGGLPAAAA